MVPEGGGAGYASSNNLGVSYDMAEASPDHEEAARWYWKAAEQWYNSSIQSRSVVLFSQGVLQDYQEAARCSGVSRAGYDEPKQPRRDELLAEAFPGYQRPSAGTARRSGARQARILARSYFFGQGV